MALDFERVVSRKRLAVPVMLTDTVSCAIAY